MQQLALRPYLTAGIAVAGAGIIAVAPVSPVAPVLPGAGAEFHAVQLTDAWSDLFTHTTANLTNISDNADWSAITAVFGKLFTDPFGVLAAFTSITPTVTTDISELPASVSVQLPPGLELAIASMGAQALASQAISNAAAEMANGNFSGLFSAPATIADAYLNGAQNVSLLGGIINIPVLNGILAPEQNFEVDLNLAKLLDALGLGNLDLSNLNVDDLLNQLGLGTLTLGSLLDALGISDDGLGDLLKLGSNITNLGGLLGFLGLGDLGLGSLSLTGILSGLGLDTDVNLNDLSLDSVLNVFGINPEINLGLGQLLTDLGFGSLVDSSLGDLLSGLPGGVLTGITGVLNSVIGTLIQSVPLLGPLLDQLLNTVLLTPQNLIDALNSVTFGDLLGGQSISETVSSLLGALGVALPTGDLTIGGILEGLGFAPATGDLTLSGLLGGLGLGGLDITGLLNGLDLGDLVGGLGLDNLPLNLGSLVGDLSDLNLADLLNDLGLGDLDLANISVGSFGGMITQLVDVIPQQILDLLGA
ncbi:hypothetical protein EHH44_01680 [Mycolicibacter terrae]|uniref:PE-PGRS family protein n=2 Tax=Mycolicibacter TaxID=1073531 RepID=A0A1A2XHU7_MYCSD|nr:MULTISPECIES: hypothetical protein [Mycolicibacter]OBH21478.1 hypothetical protein A5694_13145 [Mycolicibacter sinensis]OBI24466.1 hypothetical protein A5710_10810 [Mycolicibacter sinensis]RRR48099.1 hypothetical protein EHH44_01680 [Mycolicibacter terrae]